MNKNSKKIKFYILILTLFSAIAITFRTVACFYHLDYSSGYFVQKNFIIVSYVAALVAVLTMLTYAFLFKEEVLKPNFTSSANYVPTALVGAGLLFLCLHLYGQADANGLYMISHMQKVINPSSVLQLVCVVLGVLSAVHFFLNAFLPQNKTDLRAHFALATVLFLSFYSVYLYFDSSQLPINTPNKIIDQMAYLSSAIFFLYEARISLGREKWRSYVTFGLISAVLTAYSSIPSLILYIVTENKTSASIEENLLTFTLFVFILTRLILTSALPSVSKNEDYLCALAKYAEGRQAENDIASTAYNEAFAVQLTIDDLADGKSSFDALELDDDGDDALPLSEAESVEDFSTAQTLFEEDTLLTNEDGSQLELSYEIFEKQNTASEAKDDEESPTE